MDETRFSKIVREVMHEVVIPHLTKLLKEYVREEVRRQMYHIEQQADHIVYDAIRAAVERQLVVTVGIRGDGK
jgi:hypothetical protein